MVNRTHIVCRRGLRSVSGRGEFVQADAIAFCSGPDAPSTGAIRRQFERAAAAAGLRVWRFHGRRHHAGSIVARHADPHWVQAFLGHSKLTTTGRYMHVKARDQRDVLLDSAFALSSRRGSLEVSIGGSRAAGRGSTSTTTPVTGRPGWRRACRGQGDRDHVQQSTAYGQRGG